MDRQNPQPQPQPQREENARGADEDRCRAGSGVPADTNKQPVVAGHGGHPQHPPVRMPPSTGSGRTFPSAQTPGQGPRSQGSFPSAGADRIIPQAQILGQGQGLGPRSRVHNPFSTGEARVAGPGMSFQGPAPQPHLYPTSESISRLPAPPPSPAFLSVSKTNIESNKDTLQHQ